MPTCPRSRVALRATVLVLAVSACGHDVAVTKVDRDGDGSPAGEDCNDARDDIFPGATEICDGLDNDCDGEIDEALDVVRYPDSDGDGFGDPSRPQTSCAPDGSYIEDNTDCDDDLAEVNPDAVEICDGLDNNCDGETDEGLSEIWYPDADGDSFGAGDAPTSFCEAPGDGWLKDTADCDDGDPLINPTADEVCDDGIDQDCNGSDTHCTIYGDLQLDRDADIALVPAGDGHMLGAAVDFVQDVDGDGLPEILVGLSGASSGAVSAGGASLVELDATTTRGLVDLSTTAGSGWRNQSVTYNRRNGRMGMAVAGIEDLNADGYAEFAVMAPLSIEHELEGGDVHLFSGAATSGTTLSVSTMGLVIAPNGRNRDLASVLTVAGDLSGDGFPDLALAMTGATVTTGGSEGGLFIYHACPEGIGGCVDLDGDGTVDPTAPWVGGTIGHRDGADGILTGRGTTDRAGTAMDAGFDFNGDGMPDVAVGAPGVDGAGAVYLVLAYPYVSDYLDNAADLTLTGAATGDEAGAALARGTDLDQDGYDDLIIGAPGADSETGAVYLLLGRGDAELSGWDPAVGLDTLDGSAVGDAPGDRFGASLAVAGDLNGDGFSELLVGAPYADPDGVIDAGLVRIFRGPPASGAAWDIHATATGTEAGGLVGSDIAGGTDTNLDGYDDVLIGASGFDGGGRAFLLLGGFAP